MAVTERRLKRDRRSSKPASFGALIARLARGEPERRSFKDRRATPRVSVELECEESEGTSKFVRLTTDLSTFGLSTRHGPSLKRDTLLRLKLFLPKNPQALLIKARVLGPYDSEGGVRLKFIRPSLECVQRLHRFLAETLQLSSRA